MENKKPKSEPSGNIKGAITVLFLVLIFGFIIYDVVNHLISEQHWFGPFCFGIFGSLVLAGITTRVWNFLFKLLGNKDPLEVFREKPFWIESIDKGVSGSLLGFLYIYFTLMFHVWLKIEIVDQRILIFSIVYLTIVSFASWLYSEDGNNRGVIFYTVGLVVGALVAFFLF